MQADEDERAGRKGEAMPRSALQMNRQSTLGLVLAYMLLAACAGASPAAATCNEPTPPAHSNGLPECRAYELVGPPYEEGMPMEPLSGMFAVASDGEHLIASSPGAFAGTEEDELDPYSRSDGATYELSRTASGWQTSSLGPPESLYASAALYDASADLMGTLWGLDKLSQPEGVSDLYLERPRGAFVEIGPPTPNPDTANAGEYSYAGASADLSRVLFTTEPGYHWPFDGTVGGSSTLYEYLGTGNSTPSLVGVSGGADSTELVSQCGTLLGSSAPRQPDGSLYNAISASGERVFFTAVGADRNTCGGRQPPVDELLAREETTPGQAQTVVISESSSSYCSEGPSPPCGDANFEGASQDGSIVYFTSTQQLLAGASEDETNGDSAAVGCSQTTGAGGCNLYRDELGQAGQTLSLVSGDSSEAAGARVLGVARISEDGSHVYFVAKGVLTTQANALSDRAAAGEDNLYVYERDTQFPVGRTAFVATLSPTDAQDWAHADDRPVLTSADGRYLVFLSTADLTHEGTAPGVTQIFEYDAQTGGLVRASVGREGFDDDGRAPALGAEIVMRQADEFDSPTSVASMPAPEDGVVFFQSTARLVPEATSGEPEIYAYDDGETYLLSSGVETAPPGSSPSMRLLGSDPSADDVFFTASTELVPQNTDFEQNIYDARVEGGFPNMSQPECAGTGCLGFPPPPPTLPVAGSATADAPDQGTAAATAGPASAPAPSGTPTPASGGERSARAGSSRKAHRRARAGSRRRRTRRGTKAGGSRRGRDTPARTGRTASARGEHEEARR
jgi:hypothetical protein